MARKSFRLKLRILIVDDEEGVGDAIRAALQAADVDCVLETNATQAAESLCREKYDAIVLDAQMPPPGGLELARRVRSGGLNSRTPIIFVGGQETPDEMTRAFQSGANFFLFKPFDRAQLIQVLRAARGPIEQERRRFLRVAVRRHVVLLRGEERGEGETLDLSLEGMLVETAAAWATGSKIRVLLELTEGDEPLPASGKIARLAGPNKMGIQLDRLPEEESARLQDFLLPLILKSLGDPRAGMAATAPAGPSSSRPG
jgi:CheY-like chemotaxis protein